MSTMNNDTQSQSQSLLANLHDERELGNPGQTLGDIAVVEDEETQFDENQSISNISENKSHQEDEELQISQNQSLVDGMEKSTEGITVETENHPQASSDNSELVPMDSDTMLINTDTIHDQITQDEDEMMMNGQIMDVDDEVLEDVDEDEEENEENSTATNLPLGRVKKIMKICLATNEEEEVEEASVVKTKGKRKSGGGTKKPTEKGKNNSLIITKEAIFLTTAATELFVSAITQQSSKITASTKKKTMTIEHLKRAVSDCESFEFLQGCLQPSIIIGD